MKKYTLLLLLFFFVGKVEAQVNPNKCRDFYLDCINYYTDVSPKLADSLFHHVANDAILDAMFNALVTINIAKIKAANYDTIQTVAYIRKGIMQGYPIEWISEKKFPILNRKIKKIPMDSLSRCFFNVIDINAYHAALELDNIFSFNNRVLYQDTTFLSKKQRLKIDSIKLLKFKNYIDRFGFPTDKQIGAMAVGNVIQYANQLAVYYPPSWDYIEALFSKALSEGKLAPYYYAKLLDHRRVILDEKGKYGTSYHKPRKGIVGNKPHEFPLEFPLLVDKLRAEIGVAPIYLFVYGLFGKESKLPNGYSFDEKNFTKNIFEQCK